MFCRLYFFFETVPLETSYYLIIYWTNLRQIFRICAGVGGHDQSGLLFAVARGTLLYGNRFLARMAKTGVRAPPSYSLRWFRRPSIDIFEIFSPWRLFNHNRKPAMPILWKYSSPKTNEGQKRAFCYRVCLRLCRANYRWALPRISSV